MVARFITELQALASQFCRLDFAEDETSAQLAGRAASLSADGMEAKRENLHYSDNFLTTLQFTWHAPVRLRLAELEQALGDYHLIHRGLTPKASYVFSIERQPLSGFIYLTAASADRHGRIDVREVSLRRIAPEPFTVEQGRAVRMIVLADFSATEDASRDPLAIAIGRDVDVDEALARLVPAVHCDVLNYVDPDEQILHFHLSPATFADFEIDPLVRSVPPLSALVDLRRSFASIQTGRGPSVPSAQMLGIADLPSHWQNRARAVVAGGFRDVDELVSEIDRALSNQCEAILSHTKFKSLQAAWFGLQYLAEQIDFSTGSQIEVFSCPKDDLVETFRRGVVEPEIHHREGLPPALVVVDGSFATGDASLLQELARLSAAAEIPLVFGGFAEGNTQPSFGGRDGGSSYVASVSTRIRLRETLSARPPRRFEYVPGRLAPETALWGSGVWAFAAAAAQSVSRGDLDGTAVAPPAARAALLTTDDVCRNDADVPAANSFGEAEFQMEFDEGPQQLTVRAQAGTSAREFRRQFALGPIVQTIYRLRHQHAHRADRDAVAGLIANAIDARLPNAAVQVAFQGPPDRLRLIVHLTLPFPIAGERRSHTLDVPWRVTDPR